MKGGGDESISARQKRVQDIIDRHQAEFGRGFTEADVSAWTKEHDEALGNLAAVDPDLLVLEEEQIKKRLNRYGCAPLGSVMSAHPHGEDSHWSSFARPPDASPLLRLLCDAPSPSPAWRTVRQ